MFETPILFIIFNRPKTTQIVFNAIRDIRPRQLFVAADGPRTDNKEEIENIKETRSIIQQIDWECTLKTFFRNENRGCGYGPAEAITWFFDNVDEGIILEDDCLPHPDFFHFCSKILKLYKDDERIGVVSGTNPLVKWKANRTTHIFSHFGSTWGWASWKRAWDKFEHNISDWHGIETKKRIKGFINNDSFFVSFSKKFNEYSPKERMDDVWDVQWLFSRMKNNLYCIVSSVNLISNIGFGANANHTLNSNDKLASLAVFKNGLIIRRNKFKVDRKYEMLVHELFIRTDQRSFIKKVKLKFLKLLHGVN